LSILDEAKREQFSTINDIVAITYESMGELHKILDEYSNILNT
jgi:hypothetical protein